MHHAGAGSHYVHPPHPLFTEDEYPIRGVVTSVLDATTVEIRVHAPSKWLLPFGQSGTPLGLLFREGDLPPIRFQTRKIVEAGGEDPLVLRIQHTALPVWWYKEDETQGGLSITDISSRVRVCTTSVELIGLMDEPIRPPVEQTPTEVLQTLVEYTDMLGLSPDAEDDDTALNCFQILELGFSANENPEGLNEKSTPAQIKEAITVIMTFLSVLEAKGRHYGILGNSTTAAIQRTADFQRTLTRMQLAYGAARALGDLRASQSPDYDVTRLNYSGYTVVEASAAATGPRGRGGRNNAPVAQRPEIVLYDKLLRHCALHSLRHVKGTVYVEQRIPEHLNLRWAPRKCSMCPENSMSVMYAYKDTKELLCIEHMQQACAADPSRVENTIFTSAANYGRAVPHEMRMKTAAKPQWLIATRPAATRSGTKTWIPDMAVPSENEDIMGAEQPESTADLVRRVLDQRMMDRDQWATFIGNRGIASHLADNLAKSLDPAFPEHHPKTQLFAFLNGLYSVQENRFRPYDKLPSSWAATGAINFLPEWFDPMWTVKPLDTLGVPGYDDILKTQNFEEDTVAFLDAFLGRQLFRRGLLEDWQVAPVLLGTAGSGKSTIAKALMTLVREHNVGQLPSNCEEQYAVASLVGKIMVMCTEMKEGFKLPISVLQCMIVGDPVSVHAKYKDVFDKSEWDSHVLLVGNVIPLSWRQDVGGAMERRVVLFRLDIKPSTQDPTIQTRFFQNLGPFLVRITRAYRQLVAKVEDGFGQGKFLHHFTPRQVAAFHAMFRTETSISAAFLAHLLQSFELGFINASAPLVLEDDEELIEFYRYLKDAVVAGGKRFPGVHFTQQRIQEAVDAIHPFTRWTPDACASMAKECRVPYKELEGLYNMWCRDATPAGGRGAAANKPLALSLVLDEIGLVVSSDAENRLSQRYVYGLRKRADDGNLYDGIMG